MLVRGNLIGLLYDCILLELIGELLHCMLPAWEAHHKAQLRLVETLVSRQLYSLRSHVRRQ